MKNYKLQKTLFRASALCAAIFLSLTAAHAATTYIYVESNIGKTTNQNSIYAYKNDGAGNLTALSGSPYLTGGTGVLDPTAVGAFDADQEVTATSDGNLLYAVNGHSDTISAFSINSDGTLTTVPGSPFASNGQDPCSIGIAGRVGSETLIVANKNEDTNQNISGSLPNYTTFNVSSNGALTMNPGSTVTLAAGSSPSQVATRTQDRLVFGLEFGTSRIASYKINSDQTLTEVDSVTPPDGAVFLGEILNPKPRVLYAGLPGSSQVATYRYNSAGKLTFGRTVGNDGAAVCWLTTNPSGTFLFTAETESASVTCYNLMTKNKPSMVDQLSMGASTASNLAYDPNGDFLYVLAGNSIHILNVDANGNLSETITPVSLPEPAGEKPLGLAVVAK